MVNQSKKHKLNNCPGDLSGLSLLTIAPGKLLCKRKDCKRKTNLIGLCNYHYRQKVNQSKYYKEPCISRYSIEFNYAKLYAVWSNMKQRCYYPKDKAYKYYGGRGITVCKEWRINITSFLNWAMENGYKRELEIDRINNDKSYYPENCRFVSHKVNNQNRRKKV